ncbi:MAG: TetR/AcrR family transcriptional regulator [Pirellulaceae bacterium]|nr:TetR/AcrR family transcriptional regulator [Pirellulaceae bacterium]
MPADTRQRLVAAATKRFYRDGFRGVGLDQVLADVGISKTAFYKHFESKDDLMLAALAEHDLWVQDTFRRMMRERGGGDPIAELRSLFDVVEAVLDDPEFQGCIFVNVAIEFPLPHEPAHIAAAHSKTAMEDIVADAATRAGAADPRMLARELCLIMEGAYVTRHVTGNRGTIHIARQLAERVITAHLPQVFPRSGG